jgi:hypothetical protein
MNRTLLQRLVRLHELAPALSLALAIGIPVTLNLDPHQAPTSGPEREHVIQAVKGAPYSIGHWVGRDIPVPEAAIKLLKPNVTLSRRFSNLMTNERVDLMLVHCGDARDMLGHFPPVCYPNFGWVPAHEADLQKQPDSDQKADRHGGRPITLRFDGQVLPASMYEFWRIQDWSSETRIRIFNFFILPDGRVTRTIDDVSRGTSLLGASIYGIAQVQLITDAGMPLDDAINAAETVLGGLTDVFTELGVQRDG